MLGSMNYDPKVIAEIKELIPSRYHAQLDAIAEELQHGASRMGRKGGIARAKKLSKQRLKEIARIAANKRWYPDE